MFIITKGGYLISSLGNKEVMASNIQRLMGKKGVDRNRMSDDLGISYTTIRDWIKGLTYPRIDKIEIMADYFGVSKSELVEEFVPTNVYQINSNYQKVPIIGTIACGDPITADENIIGYREEAKDLLPAGDLFYLQSKGKSMEPTIPDGSFVLIRQQDSVENGEIAAILMNDNEEATLKRVKYQGDSVLLIPDNRDFEPIIIGKNNLAKIIGRAVKVSFDL